MPQSRIRSEQAGDWWYFGENCFTIHVLETLSPEDQFRVAMHELTEAYLCRKNGTSDEQVSRFDDQYEAERKEGKHGEYDEPGDDPRAPYREEHSAATHVERAVCHVLDISWKEPLQPALHSGAGRQKTQSPEPGSLLSSSPPPPHDQGSDQSSSR